MTKNYPSENYYKNLNYYKDMHKNGYHLINGRKRDAKDAYDGKSTLAFAPIIKKIITYENIKSMIDYGCGKGNFYRNAFNLGDTLEILPFQGKPKMAKITTMKTLSGQEIERSKPTTLVKIPYIPGCDRNNIIRMNKS